MQKPTTNTVDKTLKSVASAESLHIRINGLCMMPLIKDGAKVKIRNQRHYLPGDILVKRVANGQLVAHRLLGAYPRKGSLYYITRADNAQQEDGAVALGQIIGRVSGGECMPEAFHIPLAIRLKSAGRFFLLICHRLISRGLRPSS